MDEEALEEWLSRPTPRLRQALDGFAGDLLILGAGGKMGPSLARMARRALPPSQQVFAVSRFTSPDARHQLARHGVEAISCDLLDRAAVARLPQAGSIIFMAGQKFGTQDRPEATWMMNAVVPAIVAERYPATRTVVFSTGCVYALTEVASGGSREEDRLEPPGEYAHSCLARERIFAHYAKLHQSPTVMFRLNYAIDLRYGVLHDIARKVWERQPVDVTMGHVNVIWQGDANARALQALAYATCPPNVINVTGRECLSVRYLAERFAAIFGVGLQTSGGEGPVAWLSNANPSFELFGEPTVPLEEMIEATAAWIRQGGRSLNKPTHFESQDGRF